MKHYIFNLLLWIAAIGGPVLWVIYYRLETLILLPIVLIFIAIDLKYIIILIMDIADRGIIYAVKKFILSGYMEDDEIDSYLKQL